MERIGGSDPEENAQGSRMRNKNNEQNKLVLCDDVEALFKIVLGRAHCLCTALLCKNGRVKARVWDRSSIFFTFGIRLLGRKLVGQTHHPREETRLTGNPLRYLRQPF